MHPASQRPTSGLLVEERVPCTDPLAAEPAFIVDTDAGTLLGANPAGWTAWGLDPATAAPPLALDGAMPALRRLREIAETQAPGRRAAGDADVLDGPRAPAAHLPCRSGQGAGRRRCRQCAGARGGPGNRRKGARGKAQPPRPGSRRGARCLARPRAAHAAERRHRLCRDPEERALRPARQPALSQLRARYLRQRAACARRGRQHAAGRSHPLGPAVAGLRRRRPGRPSSRAA